MYRACYLGASTFLQEVKLADDSAIFPMGLVVFEFFVSFQDRSDRRSSELLCIRSEVKFFENLIN